MWHYKTLCITNVYIYLAIFRYWNIHRFQMQKNKKTPQNQGVAAEFCGSGNWTRTSAIRINSIIKCFAPATENQTDAYIKSVAASTGYDPHTQLNLESNAALVKLMKAIIKHENGKQPYTDEEIEVALQC